MQPKELKELHIYLSKDSTKVGKATFDGNNYTFKYEDGYNKTPFLLPDIDNPLSIFKKGYVIDTSIPFISDKSFFLCITDNFPEGFNLRREINRNNFNPYHQPLRYLSLIKNDGLFEFKTQEEV